MKQKSLPVSQDTRKGGIAVSSIYQEVTIKPWANIKGRAGWSYSGGWCKSSPNHGVLINDVPSNDKPYLPKATELGIRGYLLPFGGHAMQS